MRTLLTLLTLMVLPGCAGDEAQAPKPPPEDGSPTIANEVEEVRAPQRDQGRNGIEQVAKPAAAASGPAPGACQIQDGVTVPPNLLRAVGTEPFWGARIEGRCVTYSHPDDPSGLRIWTRFSGAAEAGQWTGNYAGKPFVLRTQPQPDCSDGMSDRRYPIAVTLTVSGEERKGCADRV